MGFSHDELGPARQPACSERGHYRRLASQGHAAPRNRRRAYQRNWLRTIPAGFITGSKRRIEETRSYYPSFDGPFCSRHSEGPSKKLGQLGHQIHNNWPADYSSDSSIRRPGPNSLEKDFDNPKTSTSKSCEEISQNCQDRLGIVMRMPSDLDSLPRNAAWNSLASKIVRKVPVALSWRAIPTSSHLPTPDAELFKEYSGHGGLMCVNVSKLPNKEELLMFNPSTGAKRVLPPLHHPRIPVLVNTSVDFATESYKVVVAGSSSARDEHLSKKVEVFDSLTSKWKGLCDFPVKSGGRWFLVYPERTNNRIIRERIQFALLLLYGAVMPHGARAEKQSVDITSSLWNSSSGWATAVTLLLGFTVIGAGVAWGLFRRHRAPGDRFDIIKGLEDSDIPRVANPVFTILPDIN